MRLGTNMDTLANHAIRPNSDLRAPIAECGVKVSLTFTTSTDPELLISCQKCRKILNMPSTMNVRNGKYHA